MPFIELTQHTLYYREQGSGPLLVILPGNTASSALHDRELAEFSRRYHTVALDLLGTGRSQRVDVWPADWWQQAARDALALIESLGEQQAVLVGTSGGAVAALWGAILGPARVRAVVADSLTERLPPEILRAAVCARSQKNQDQIRFWSAAHGPDWEQVVEADNRILLSFALQGGDWFGGRLREIACPVLLSASLEDEMLSDTGSQLLGMAEQIPDCEVFLVNSGGHPLMWSRADAFHSAAESFLRRKA